jgi:MFS family permease
VRIERNFGLLWTAQTISGVGSAVTVVAFPLAAIAVLHASAFQVGALTAASWVAWLGAPPVGAWVDRVRRRPLLILADLGRAGLLASVPVAWAMHALTLAQLLAVAVLVGLLTVVYEVADLAFLPAVVPRERLVAANGALRASLNGSSMVGPGLAGLLVQLFGAPLTLLADVASFVGSAGCVLAVRIPEPAVARDTRRLRAEIAEGLRYVVRHPLPRTVAVASATSNLLFGGYDAVIFVFLVRQVGLPAGLVGLLLTANASGGLFGSVVAGPLARRFGDGPMIRLAVLVIPAGALLIPLTGKGFEITWYLVGAALVNVGLAGYTIYSMSAVQSAAPAAMLGRVTASIRLVGRGAIPIGALAGGALAGALSPRATLTLIAALLVLVPVWIRMSPFGRARRLAAVS